VSLPPRIALATHNPHKLRELGRICADWPTEWVSVDTHDPSAFPDVAETGATYLDNARLKAEAVAAALGLPALADDSGIEVDALGGAPGPRSARYAGEHASDEENLRALIQAIRGVPASGRSARYRCVAALAMPEGGFEHVEGTCEGTLRTTPAGAGLSNMADRIGALGGEVAWRAAPGHGTVVVGRTPVPRAAPDPATRRPVPVGE